MYLCVRGICQESELSCICVRGISQESELSCICVLKASVKKLSCHVFVC